jgi:hypothetical protein
MEGNGEKEDRKKLSAVCGLFCPSCTVYIGSTEDPERLAAIGRRFGQPAEAWRCEGCRSDKRSHYCENICTMAPCAARKGIDFCGECAEYPCEALKQFQAERPHRIELWESLARINEVGYDQWYEEKLAHYRCPQCGTINSAYDLACRNCGREPSCPYVERHRESIVASSAKPK